MTTKFDSINEHFKLPIFYNNQKIIFEKKTFKKNSLFSAC